MKKVRIKLGDHLAALNMQQKEFAAIAGMRRATISHLVLNKYDRLHLPHLVRIMDVLGTTDFNDILELVEEKEENNT